MSKPASAVFAEIERWLVRRLSFFATILIVLGAGAGCGRDVAPAEALATTTQSLTTPHELRLALPAGAPLLEVAVGASASLEIGSKAALRSQAGFATVASSGAGATTLGTDAAVGDLVSQGAVGLGTRAHVNGDLRTAAASVTQGNGATVSGAIETGATLIPVQPFAWTVAFESSSLDVLVSQGVDRTLAPGAYQDVSVKPHGTIRLQTGTYYVRSLGVWPNATVIADTQGGPIFLYLSERLDLKSPVSTVGPGSNLFVGYLGEDVAAIVAPFRGTVVAPNAGLRLGAGAGEVRGSFFGKDVRVDSNVAFAFEGFSSWDLIFPPTPILECVVHFDGTHSNALWGYENPLGIPVTIPVGPRNQLSPTDSRLITTFQPGRHEKVFFAFFGTEQATWQLGGGTPAVANTNTSPRCHGADLPPLGPPDVLPRSESASAPQSALLALMQTRTLGTRSGTLAFPPPAAPPAPGRFRFIIDDQYLSGNDAICGPRQLSVNVFINGDGEIRNLAGCTNPSACGVPAVFEVYERDIAAGQTEIPIAIDISERDDPPCGGDDDHILTAHLVASADTGAIIRGDLTTFDSDGNVRSTIFLDPGVSSVQGLDDFGVRFATEVAPPPQICGAWKAQYVDSGSRPGLGFDGSEDFVKTLEPEDVPASFARAELVVRSGGVTQFEWRGVLDRMGCIPRANTPAASLLLASSNPVIRLSLESEACWDPEGGDCTAPAGDGGTRGARMRVLIPTQLSRITPRPPLMEQVRCAFITRDPGATEPDCEALRDLPGWDPAGRPPPKILVVNSSNDPVTRAMALASHILRLEDEGAELGVRAALLQFPQGRRPVTPGAVAGLVEIAPNTLVCFTNPGPGIAPCADREGLETLTTCLLRGACDTAASDPIAVAPDRVRPTGERILGDTSWKYVLAHEIGHTLQARAMGFLSPRYTGLGTDPGISVPDRCSCNHVTTSNVLHCLQSIEEPNAAQVEGWAQFFASRVWNKASEGDCVFKYYKEFLNEGCMPGVPSSECTTGASGVSSRPPIPVDCLAPVRWRNNQCFDATVAPAEAVTEFGVEYDFMGFFYAVNTQGPDRASMNDLFGIYTTACGGKCGSPGDQRVTWDGCTGIGCASAVVGLSGAATTYFGGSANSDRFISLGTLYGVSRSVQR